LLIFVAAIGVLAWVTQYLPNRGGPPPEGDKPDRFPKLTPKLLHFEDSFAHWEGKPNKKTQSPEMLKQEPYPAEYEVATDTRHDGGHFDYVFQNKNPDPVALGVLDKSCQCAELTLCIFSDSEWARYVKGKGQADLITRSRQSSEDGFAWKPLIVGDPKGVIVPGKSHGVVRLFWNGRTKREPEKILLKFQLWVSPPNKYEERSIAMFAAYIQYVRPVICHPERVPVGVVNPQAPSLSATFHCWSATRDLEVRSLDEDPCFVVQTTRLTPQQCQELTTSLRKDGVLTRVRSGYQVEVTVHEHKDGKQLDLGTIHRSPKLRIKGDGEELSPTLPVVRGRVQGDVKVGALDEQHGINLKYFKGVNGTTARALLFAKPGLKLEYEGFQPPVLRLGVKLGKQPREDIPGWTCWEVLVKVAPGLEPGPLPEDSGLVLRAVGKTTRRVRIPLIGSVGRD
jgi:hypothetical protein